MRVMDHVTRVLLAVVVSALLPTMAGAATAVFVSPSGFCFFSFPCFTTIQAGVNAAGGGPSTVLVFPGTYAESVDLSTMGTGPGAGGADNIVITAVNSVGSPTPGAASVVPPAGEAFRNSVTPFPFSVQIRGFDVTSPTTDAIDIEGASGSVLIADVTATGATYDGVDVRADGNITLRNVDSSNNGNDGFQIEFEGPGNLVVSDCVANDNGLPDTSLSDDDGFQIVLNTGTAEITGSRAERNGGSGFEFHVRDGGEVPSLQLVDTVASHNDANGVHIEDFCEISKQGPVCPSSGPGVKNPIVNVTIDGLVAESNGRDGLELNQGWSNDPGITPLVQVRNSRANGNGFSEDNTGDGFEVEPGQRLSVSPDLFSVADAIFENLIANGNFDDGIETNGRQGHLEALRDVTMLQITANDNGNDGVEIEGSGDVVLSDIDAHRNGLRDESGPTSPPSPSRRDGVQVGGLFRDSATITATRIAANDNGGNGIHFRVRTRVEARVIEARGNGPIVCKTLPDTSELCDEDGKDGLQINQSDASPQLELIVENCSLVGNSADGLDADDVEGAVTVSDCDTNDNGDDGLDTNKASVVALTRITATGNGDDGIDSGALGGIGMADVCAADNTSDGIKIGQHGGFLSISDAAALRNRYGVAFKEMSTAPVSLSGSDLSGNSVGGAINGFAPITIAASGNFWGAASGPTHPLNPLGSGDAVFDMFTGAAGTVDYSGFSAVPLQPAECPQRVPVDADCPCFSLADLSEPPLFGTCRAYSAWAGGYTQYLGWPFFSGETWMNGCWFSSPYVGDVIRSPIAPIEYQICRQTLLDAATIAAVTCQVY